jgi:glycogen operon protein
MLTAGDEGGRSQRGNNNAYCQDNEITWLDWKALDEELVAHTAFVSSLRRRFPVFSESDFLNGDGDVEWISLSGQPMTVGEWETPGLATLGMLLSTGDRSARRDTRLAVLFNRSRNRQLFTLPSAGGSTWRRLSAPSARRTGDDTPVVEPRSVAFFVEN